MVTSPDASSGPNAKPDEIERPIDEKIAARNPSVALIRTRPARLTEGHEPVAVKYLRPHFSGPIIAAGGFDGDSAEAIVQSGDADLVAFGRHFSSNPDLPYRLKHKLPLTPYVRTAFWGGDETNYTDFPALEPADVAA